jgi:hypothetical protein
MAYKAARLLCMSFFGRKDIEAARHHGSRRDSFFRLSGTTRTVMCLHHHNQPVTEAQPRFSYMPAKQS